MDVELFAYRTTTESLDDVVARLARRIAQAKRSPVHLIGHSLGGVVLLRMLEHFASMPPGRVVLLGSPVQGSAVARRLGRLALGRRMLGSIAKDELLADAPRVWNQTRELGIVAGTKPMGLGRVVLRFQEPNDGTVAARETELPGATERIVLPVSHFGMLLSARVVEQTGRFLRDGRFSLA